MIDYLAIESFLDAPACAALRAELRQAAGSQATVLSAQEGGLVQPLVRRASRMELPAATGDHIIRLLMERKGMIERHFGLALSACEQPQFLRYLPGDFFVAHQDGNTPLIHDRSRFRKISAVIFLSAQAQAHAPDSYSGGALVLHGPYSGPELRVPITPEPGTLVCFRAETTHEVLPITDGERFTIVSWFL